MRYVETCRVARDVFALLELPHRRIYNPLYRREMYYFQFYIFCVHVFLKLILHESFYGDYA